MPHLEEQPRPFSQNDPSKRRKKLSIFCGFLLGITLVGGYVLTNMFPVIPTDSVSQQETAQRLADFSSMNSLQVLPVAKENEQEALGRLGLQAKDQEQMRQTLQESNKQAEPSGLLSSATIQRSIETLRLVELALWDTHSEDGDIVHVSSEGYERDVTLKKIQTTITLPCRDMSRVKITGVRDGGGGITLGVKAQQSVLMPIMRPRQSIELPISFTK